jgi:hypothetical protein
VNANPPQSLIRRFWDSRYCFALVLPIVIGLMAGWVSLAIGLPDDPGASLIGPEFRTWTGKILLFVLVAYFFLKRNWHEAVVWPWWSHAAGILATSTFAGVWLVVGQKTLSEVIDFMLMPVVFGAGLVVAGLGVFLVVVIAAGLSETYRSRK